ncbi:molybdenum cofactor guanylyltransferase [Acinetobacter baretiae]|uniref:molybdenum cofactor guanylyltransferase n=1 Tax=Acinetobacter baretiae TaxID=2605383 RepID=UPI001F1956EE|nr:NTP transferase domain-containing protein [Acinetobacter baretiae]
MCTRTIMSNTGIEAVILAGGQAQRMAGVNKLLQCFDGQIQLTKIYQQLSHTVSKIWVNSHRDVVLYQDLVPNIHVFHDDVDGFLGPLMGIKTAWSYIQSDYILFIPCDVTYIPTDIVLLLHQKMTQCLGINVVYLEINGTPLYPFCLMHRSSKAVIDQQLLNQKYALKQCFQQLSAQTIQVEHTGINFHSINSWDELQQYQTWRD